MTGTHRKAYVPIYGDSIHGQSFHPNYQAAVIDLDSRALLGLIDITQYVSPNKGRAGRIGLFYQCCENSGTVIVSDPSENRIVGDIDVPSTNIHHLTPLPQADKIFTESEEDGVISVIELSGHTGKVVHDIRMPGPLNGIDAPPVDPIVVATADVETDRSFHVVDTSTRKLVKTVPLVGTSEMRADRTLHSRRKPGRGAHLAVVVG